MPLEKNNKISLVHKECKVKNHYEKIALSQEVSKSTLLSGSLTVEAALVFPIFLFALVGMLFFFRILQVTQSTYGALAATGSRLSLETEEVSAIKAIGYFQGELWGENCSYIMCGKGGISWRKIALEDEYIELTIQYRCRMPIQIFHVKSIPIKQQIKIRRWIGYHKEMQRDEQESWVYITPTGQVYHTTKECTHLQLSIYTLGKEQALAEGYSQCLLCNKEIELYAYYYVTKEGEKYHKKINCSGLKRTLYMIKLSEVGQRRACSRCGGTE